MTTISKEKKFLHNNYNETKRIINIIIFLKNRCILKNKSHENIKH